MKKKIIKIFLILVSVLLIANVTFAAEVGDFIDGLTGTKPEGDVSTKIEDASGQILTTVQYVGVAVAVIMLMVVAIKYFSAAPGEQAKLKQKLVVYVVGAVILFAATGIIQIVKSFGMGLGRRITNSGGDTDKYTNTSCIEKYI